MFSGRNTQGNDMTTANKVTIFRILLIPFFIIELLYYFKDGEEMHRVLGMVAFALAAILDGVDGYIARHYNQKSELGAILDPLADKLLLVSAIVVLSFSNEAYLKPIPLWFTVTVLSRDVLLTIGLVVVYMTCGKVMVRPRMLGKIATVLQMITVVWTLLKWDSVWLIWWTRTAAICTAISGLIYIWDGMRQLSASPTSLPTPEQ